MTPLEKWEPLCSGMELLDSSLSAKRHFFSVSSVSDYIDSNISFLGYNPKHYPLMFWGSAAS